MSDSYNRHVLERPHQLTTEPCPICEGGGLIPPPSEVRDKSDRGITMHYCPGCNGSGRRVTRDTAAVIRDYVHGVEFASQGGH